MKEYKIAGSKTLLLSDCEQLYFFDRKKIERKTAKGELYGLNNLTGSEWTLHSKSVQTFNGAITEKRKQHGAAY
ncbi:MAG: hypothetical protein LBF01_05485, partial [Bacteroidales bacterium]|nr:hypothetical protein [Bacteroidales bacterium]